MHIYIPHIRASVIQGLKMSAQTRRGYGRIGSTQLRCYKIDIRDKIQLLSKSLYCGSKRATRALGVGQNSTL